MHGLVALTNTININSKGATLIIKFLNWVMRRALIVFFCPPFFSRALDWLQIQFSTSCPDHTEIFMPSACTSFFSTETNRQLAKQLSWNFREFRLSANIFSMYQHQIDICELGFFCILCAKSEKETATMRRERALIHFYTDTCVIVVSTRGAGGRRFYRHN